MKRKFVELTRNMVDEIKQCKSADLYNQYQAMLFGFYSAMECEYGKEDDDIFELYQWGSDLLYRAYIEVTA